MSTANQMDRILALREMINSALPDRTPAEREAAIAHIAAMDEFQSLRFSIRLLLIDLCSNSNAVRRAGAPLVNDILGELMSTLRLVAIADTHKILLEGTAKFGQPTKETLTLFSCITNEKLQKSLEKLSNLYQATIPSEEQA